VTHKELLTTLVYQLEALSNAVGALEDAAVSPIYGGRQLTKQQLQELRAQSKAKQNDIFASLHAAVLALPLENLPAHGTK
jgi:hypothetical protein